MNDRNGELTSAPVPHAGQPDATDVPATPRWRPGMSWLRSIRLPARRAPKAPKPPKVKFVPPVKVSKPVPVKAPRATPGRPARSRWDVAAVVALAALVLTIVVVGLRVGMGALKDSALAAHIDKDAAELYWLGVDGLIVVAIIAALVLRNVSGASRYCLAVVATFTTASGLLQYLHGLGWFTPNRVTGVVAPLPWGVVLVIAALVTLTILCSTHLFVHVLRHLFPGSAPEQAEQAVEVAVEHSQATAATVTPTAPNHPQQGGQLDAETEREVRKWFAALAVNMLIDNGAKPVRARIARDFQIADRQAGYVIADVIRERELGAEREAAAKAAVTTLAAPPKPIPAVNGSAPAGGQAAAAVNGEAL